MYGEPPADGFPSQRASNAESVCLPWRHHNVTFDDPNIHGRRIYLHDRISSYSNQVMLLYSTLYVFISGYIITLHFSVRDQCLSRIGACCNARDEYNRDKISSTRKYSLVISVVLQISGHREISANSIWTSSLLDGGPFQSGRSFQVVSHERQNKMIS